MLRLLVFLPAPLALLVNTFYLPPPLLASTVPLGTARQLSAQQAVSYALLAPTQVLEPAFVSSVRRDRKRRLTANRAVTPVFQERRAFTVATTIRTSPLAQILGAPTVPPALSLRLVRLLAQPAQSAATVLRQRLPVHFALAAATLPLCKLQPVAPRARLARFPFKVHRFVSRARAVK